MNLYEITNGWEAESYVRAYAWAASAEDALSMARGSFAATRDNADDLAVTLLFSDTAAPFCTIPSGHGWRTE